MGCTSSEESKIVVFNDFQYLKTGTLSIELTQLFLVANNLIKEVQQLYWQVESNRLILMRITKVSLTASQTLLDAFGFWTRLVSICNLGESLKNGVFYRFDNEFKSLSFNLGLCGDLKLQWFGEVLNEFLESIDQLNNCIQRILEQLKFVQEKVIKMASNLKEKNSTFKQNIALIKFNLSFIKIINAKLVKYCEEIQMLRNKYEQIGQGADEQGLLLYKKYGARKMIDGQKYCMKVKVNIIIEQCYHSQFCSEIELDLQNKQKEKRKLKKPAWTFGDDIGIGVKKFPFRIRWTGCDCVDHSFFIISKFLENHSQHLLLLRKLSVILRYLTQAYKTDEDTLSRAWSIFCNHLTSKERIIIQNNASIIEGLKKFKLKDVKAEKTRIYFIQFLELFDEEQIKKLKDEWQKYLDGQASVLSLWSKNQIFSTDEYKNLPVADKYYALTSMAKNVYALQHYYPIATNIYKTVYEKKIKKGLEFLDQIQSIYISSSSYILPYDQLYTLSKSEDNENLIKTKEVKFKYAYSKFEQKT